MAAAAAVAIPPCPPPTKLKPTLASTPVPPMAGLHERSIAASMNEAKQRLIDNETFHDSGIATPATPPSPAEIRVVDSYAFAFDIDGVLIRGGKPIPEAVEAMKMLNGANEYGVTIPYIFLTNGGGKTEAERCKDLSAQLELDVSEGQFICGHTPMKEMADKYSTVLVVGGEGEKCRHVAEGYGFRDVITPGDIIKANKHTTPFRKLTDEEHATCRTRDFDAQDHPAIEAIFVFADSRDWAGDQQIILDVLLSKGGRVGTRAAACGLSPHQFQQSVPLYFSHNDMVWSTAHDHSRIGMGALRASLEAMYAAVTHGQRSLVSTAFGKPQQKTYEFASRLLQTWRRDMHGIDAPPSTVYFVGDTPESDVRGTNEYDASGHCGQGNEWFSILVKTGVYQDGTEPRFKPRATVENVLEAVRFGIEREAGKLSL